MAYLVQLTKKKVLQILTILGQSCSDCLLPMMLTANKQEDFWAFKICPKTKKCFIALTLYYYFSLSQDKQARVFWPLLIFAKEESWTILDNIIYFVITHVQEK